MTVGPAAGRYSGDVSVDNDVQRARSRGWRRIYFNWATIPFWSVHIGAAVGLALTGFSWSGLAFAAATYAALMFFVTAGYHRYFSHRSYKTSRPVQFLLGLAATLTLQKGPLWWASHHRRHHKESDGELDVHSPVTASFWWAHMGWILCRDFEGTDYDRVRDLARFPELVWLNRLSVVPPLAAGIAVGVVGGLPLLAWFLLAITLTWHGTFTINSLAHVIGRRRYLTGDDSRNHLGLALITHGEGWHNNHHHYQSSCRQGFRWYEIDVSYYVVRLLAAMRLVWDVRQPPRHVVEGGRRGRPRAPAPGPEAAANVGETLDEAA